MVTLVVGWLGASALAGGGLPPTVTFNFDGLEIRRGDHTVSDYMTGLYGSEITTDGVRTLAERDDDADVFIATSLQLLNRGDFIIEFLDVPILGAEFEGHVIDATATDDFRFRAFHGDDEVFLFTRNTGEEVFSSGWLDFPEPVDRLMVSDSGRRDVGIDDFTVQPVPEPATVVLALLGTGWGYAARRRGR